VAVVGFKHLWGGMVMAEKSFEDWLENQRPENKSALRRGETMTPAEVARRIRERALMRAREKLDEKIVGPGNQK
jgi:hypothetical protein